MHILINLAEHNHLGCSMKCPFCAWYQQDYGKYWFPSDDELDKALEKSPNFLVLSGGGDPLYHFEKNKDLIKHFVDYVTEHGAVAGIYSHDLATLWSYRKLFSTWPVKFIISVRRHYSVLEEKIVEYFAANHQLHIISTVFNDSLDAPNWQEIQSFINTFRKYAPIIFREHWVYSYEDREQVKEWRKQLRELRCCFAASDHYRRTQVMFEGKFTTCGEIDKTVLGIEKNR